jgi:hypothetical protein
MDVEFWIFSNRDPFKIFYLLLAKNNIFHQINEDYNDSDYSKIMGFLNNTIFKNLSQEQIEIKIIKLLERHQFPFSKDDHIIPLLMEIGIEFKDYFNWLFDELKHIVKDEVGFIFYEEFKKYHRLLLDSETGVYINSILRTNSTRNDYYDRRGSKTLYKGRMIENFAHHARGQITEQEFKNNLYKMGHHPWGFLDIQPEKVRFGYCANPYIDDFYSL